MSTHMRFNTFQQKVNCLVYINNIRNYPIAVTRHSDNSTVAGVQQFTNYDSGFFHAAGNKHYIRRPVGMGTISFTAQQLSAMAQAHPHQVVAYDPTLRPES